MPFAPNNVFGANESLANLVNTALPDDVRVRIASAVGWDGNAFIGLTVIRGHTPVEDGVIVTQSYTAGQENRTQKLVNEKGLTASSVAVFFGIWRFETLDWKIMDIPFPPFVGVP